MIFNIRLYIIVYISWHSLYISVWFVCFLLLLCSVKLKISIVLIINKIILKILILIDLISHSVNTFLGVLDGGIAVAKASYCFSSYPCWLSVITLFYCMTVLLKRQKLAVQFNELLLINLIFLGSLATEGKNY